MKIFQIVIEETTPNERAFLEAQNWKINENVIFTRPKRAAGEDEGVIGQINDKLSTYPSQGYHI